MRALIYNCPYLERGVECWNAPSDGSRGCGCKPTLRRGLSRSHARKLRKQLGSRIKLACKPREKAP